MSANPIPLVDLGLQHRRLAEEVNEAISSVVSSAAFILGPYVEQFEREFAEYCQIGYAVGVANGTDAVELALRVVGVAQGDEVIIPANTFVATAEAVANCGARPVLVDCNEHHLIDPGLIASAVTDRTKAVVPVHLYGQMADMEAVRQAVGPNVMVVEDAAQAQGAERWGRRAGSVGNIGATSFYPGKNLGAYGDAGAVLTNSLEMHNTLRAWRNHGGVRRYEHSSIGRNSRLDGIQASVLSVKLKVLDEWNQERRDAADVYSELLSGVEGVVRPRVVDGNKHVWHLYVIQVEDRDSIVAKLNQQGVGAAIHYPKPVHLTPAFAGLGYDQGDFPVAEAAGRKIMSLPIYPGITESQQARVVAALAGALHQQ